MPGILFKSNTENTLKKISAWNHISKSIFFSFSDKEFAALRISRFPNTLGHTLERVRGRFLLSLRRILGKRDGSPGAKWQRKHKCVSDAEVTAMALNGADTSKGTVCHKEDHFWRGTKPFGRMQLKPLIH